MSAYATRPFYHLLTHHYEVSIWRFVRGNLSVEHVRILGAAMATGRNRGRAGRVWAEFASALVGKDSMVIGLVAVVTC